VGFALDDALIVGGHSCERIDIVEDMDIVEDVDGADNIPLLSTMSTLSMSVPKIKTQWGRTVVALPQSSV